MTKLICIILLLLVTVFIHSSHSTKWEGSCDLKETINITGGYRDEKGNFVYDTISFPPNAFGEASSVIVNFSKFIEVQPHIRGCICNFKPCIRVCSNEIENLDTSNNVVSEEGNFTIVHGAPCKRMFILDKSDEWKMLKNGSILFEHEVVNFNQYCFENESVYVCLELLNEFIDINLLLYPIGESYLHNKIILKFNEMIFQAG